VYRTRTYSLVALVGEGVARGWRDRIGGTTVGTRNDARPGRITFLVWRDTSHPEGGGSEVYVEHMAEHLAREGWTVTIVCAAHRNAPADEVRTGVHYRRRGGRTSVYPHGLRYLIGHEGRSSDLVVDVQNGIPFFSPLVRRRPLINLVHHVHREQWGIVYPGLRGRIGWWLESVVAPRLYRGRQYVTVSGNSAAELIELGVRPAQLDVIHNGIDVPHPSGLGPRSVEPTICVLGRLVPHKRVEHAIAVAAALRDRIPGLRMEIVGDGWWRARLEEHARALGVDDIVRFLGQVSVAERDAALDRAWVLAAPSVKEGWGIAVMEAAARGVPTVAYRSAGGVRESVLDGITGRLTGEDLAEFTAAIERLLNDEWARTRMGDAARARAAGFDWAGSAAKFTSLVQAQIEVGQRVP
jgi:glycosyltransferase involved in cell wall biosynthesis